MENENNVTPEATIPQESASEVTPEVKETEGTPANSDTNDGQGTGNNDSGADDIPENHEPEFSLPIVYNKEGRNLNRDEAIKYAQMGLYLQESGINLSEAKEIHAKLDFIATLRGVERKALVDEIFDSDEKTYREELAGEGMSEKTIDSLVALRNSENKEKYEAAIAKRKADQEALLEQNRKSLESRLADELIELKEMCPEVESYESLPDSVKEMAVKGLDLTSAYLRFAHSERVKIEKATKAAEDAAKATAGSLSGEVNTPDNTQSAFLKGLWGK